MTTFKKALWRIAGIVPTIVYTSAMAIYYPLNYYNGIVRQKFGLAVWIVLFVLYALFLMPLGIWNTYCVDKSNGTTKPNWWEYLILDRKEKIGALIFLGILVLMVIAVIFYKPL